VREAVAVEDADGDVGVANVDGEEHVDSAYLSATAT
jgi:hypothetical protein